MKLEVALVARRRRRGGSVLDKGQAGSSVGGSPAADLAGGNKCGDPTLPRWVASSAATVLASSAVSDTTEQPFGYLDKINNSFHKHCARD